MMNRATEFLRGINGGIEVNRLVAFLGGVGVVGGSLGFTGWDMWRGGTFDVSDFALSLAGAVSILTGGTGLAVRLKDTAVAAAKITEQTGAVPAPPPDGPRVPTGKPPPVDDGANATPSDPDEQPVSDEEASEPEPLEAAATKPAKRKPLPPGPPRPRVRKKRPTVAEVG